jgi:hypothetical protein
MADDNKSGYEVGCDYAKELDLDQDLWSLDRCVPDRKAYVDPIIAETERLRFAEACLAFQQDILELEQEYAHKTLPLATVKKKKKGAKRVR